MAQAGRWSPSPCSLLWQRKCVPNVMDEQHPELGATGDNAVMGDWVGTTANARAEWGPACESSNGTRDKFGQHGGAIPRKWSPTVRGSGTVLGRAIASHVRMS